MPPIVLATLNAKYAHASLGLRCLSANLGELAGSSALHEFTIAERPVDIAERILSAEPRIVGLGVYVWNTRPSFELVRLLKGLRPGLCVVVGGPEVSHEPEAQAICGLADFVVSGEGEHAFRELARAVLAGRPPSQKLIKATPPALETLALPYGLYSDTDIRERVVYVESSRGCPYGCQFCLSALERRVREFPLDGVLAALDALWRLGLRHYRFIDRTFNLSLTRSTALLDFFLARLTPDTFIHLEIVPEHVPPALLAALRRFPPGTVQLEVGVQSFAPEVALRIERPLRPERVEEGLAKLRDTGAHLHADLIVGLPGESLASFATGFDRLVGLGPHEIQVGILKRLHGALIARHTDEWRMLYNPEPPYDLLENRLIDFATMQRLKRFAHYWNLVANSGNFRDSVALLWRGTSPFTGFLSFADWLYARTGQSHAIALERLVAHVLEYLTGVRGVPAQEARSALDHDYVRGGRRPLALLQAGASAGVRPPRQRRGLPARQARHQR